MVRGRIDAFFSGLEIPFPGNGDRSRQETRFERELLRRKPKHLVLAGPFSRQVGEANYSHAMRKASATRPYLPRLSSNLVMRRQSLASISSHMEGDPCFGGGAGEDVVGIATLVARYLASDLFCRSVRRVITSLVIAGSESLESQSLSGLV